MNFKEFNQEVLYVTEDIAKISMADIEWLKRKALANERKRIRLCFHEDTNDFVHEMLIVHTKGTYVRPHKHLNKSESFYVIEGSVDVVIFNEQGRVTQVTSVGEYSSGRKFYYRMATAHYHMLIIQSDFLVFFEITKGPFIKSNTVFAPWSPEENDIPGYREYMKRLIDRMPLNT